jgi:hypothetical protein
MNVWSLGRPDLAGRSLDSSAWGRIRKTNSLYNLHIASTLEYKSIGVDERIIRMYFTEKRMWGCVSWICLPQDRYHCNNGDEHSACKKMDNF